MTDIVSIKKLADHVGINRNKLRDFSKRGVFDAEYQSEGHTFVSECEIPHIKAAVDAEMARIKESIEAVREGKL